MPQLGKHDSYQVCRFPSELLAPGVIFLCMVALHRVLKRWEWPFPAFPLFDSDRAGLGVGGGTNVL